MIAFLVLIFISCGYLEADEVCYAECGCFVDTPPWDHLPLPEPPRDIEIENRLYTQGNRVIADIISIGDVPISFDPLKRTMYLIHGYTESGDVWDDTKDMILDNFDYNVIVVHWREGANNINYLQSASNTRVVGGCTAALIDHLVLEENAPMDRQYCVGLSLGGHTCSFVGKSLNGRLGRITALDPAGPGFEKNDSRVRLDKTDANLVDTIHTNGEEGAHLGMGYSVSHVDFYPNGGTEPQPPCAGGICSHLVSREYFRASMDASEACRFTAYPCESQTDANLGRCNTCTPATTCQRMGYHAESEPGRGTFYLTTQERYPYCDTRRR